MPKRYAARRDANEAPIVAGLRAVGCKVFLLNNVGSTAGVPDLLVAHNGAWFCMEIKNKAGKNRLSAEQKALQGDSDAPIHLVYTLDEAFEIIGVSRFE